MALLGRFLKTVGNQPKPQPFSDRIFIDDVKADVEIIKGFKNDYFFAALALHFRIANSTDYIVHFAVKSMSCELTKADELWEYCPGSHGAIAANATRSFSAKKMKLQKPIQLKEGIFQFESSICLTIEYEAALNVQSFQSTEQIEAVLTTNKQRDSLRYMFEFH